MNMSGSVAPNCADQCPTISDDFAGLDKNHFQLNRFYEPFVDYVLISEQQINRRIKSLALQIHASYKNGPLTLICVLKGSFSFCAALYSELTHLRASDDVLFPIFVEFMRLKSYCDTKSTGNVQILNGYATDMVGLKDVLLVEDIVDTGRSMEKLVSEMRKHVKCVRIATLLSKRIPSCPVKPDFVGFDVPNRFVVGYGLDYNEHFRELSDICVLNKLGIEHFKHVTT